MNTIFNLLSEGVKLIEQGEHDFIDYQVKDDDLAAIVYTSGTTGASKGVVLTHKNIATNAVAACKNVQAVGTTVCVLPLHHTFSFTIGICSILLYRQPIYINKSMRNIMSDIQKAKPSYLFLVPMIVETMYKKYGQPQKNRKRIRH